MFFVVILRKRISTNELFRSINLKERYIYIDIHIDREGKRQKESAERERERVNVKILTKTSYYIHSDLKSLLADYTEKY